MRRERVLSRLNQTHHGDDLWVDLLRNDSSLSGDILEHLVKSLSLDALTLKVRAGVVEVEDDGALLKLSDEELGSIRLRHLWKTSRDEKGRRVSLVSAILQQLRFNSYSSVQTEVEGKGSERRERKELN